MTQASEKSQTAVFVTGSTMRHVIVMTATASLGLMAIFVVDLLTLLYISWLGQKPLTAGVGIASVVLFYATSINIGLMIAISAMVSRALGAGNREEARRIAGASMLHMVVFAAAVSLVALPFLPMILTLLGAVGETHAAAHRYLVITLPANVLMALGMGYSGILRAVGDAKRAMYVTLIGGLITAVLDPVLILWLRLELEGAGIAIVISRLCFALVGYYGAVMVHDLVARPGWREVLERLKPMVMIAAPAILTNLASPVAISFITRLMAHFGDPAIAATAIIDRLIPVAFGGVFALSGAVGPILGQNWGAGRYDRMRRALMDGYLFVLVYVGAMWIALIVLRNQIGLFFGVSGLTAEYVAFFCLTSGFAWLALGLLFTANASFNNLGFPLYATAFNWGRATLGTIPFAWLGAVYGGAKGVQVGFAAGAMVFGFAAAYVAYDVIKRLERRALLQAEAKSG